MHRLIRSRFLLICSAIILCGGLAIFSVLSTSTRVRYTNARYGFSFDYPASWRDAGRGLFDGDFFTKPPDVDVLDISLIESTSSPADLAQAAITADGCMGPDGKTKNRVIESEPSGTLFVLYCSAGTESYNYIFATDKTDRVTLSYHDDFDSGWSESRKLEQLNDIVSSVRVQAP